MERLSYCYLSVVNLLNWPIGQTDNEIEELHDLRVIVSALFILKLHTTLFHIVVLILADYIPLYQELSELFADFPLLSLRIFETEVGQQILLQALIYRLKLFLCEQMLLGKHYYIAQNVLRTICLDFVDLQLARL